MWKLPECFTEVNSIRRWCHVRHALHSFVVHREMLFYSCRSKRQRVWDVCCSWSFCTLFGRVPSQPNPRRSRHPAPERGVPGRSPSPSRCPQALPLAAWWAASSEQPAPRLGSCPWEDSAPEGSCQAAVLKCFRCVDILEAIFSCGPLPFPPWLHK